MIERLVAQTVEGTSVFDLPDEAVQAIEVAAAVDAVGVVAVIGQFGGAVVADVEALESARGQPVEVIDHFGTREARRDGAIARVPAADRLRCQLLTLR